MIDFWQALHVKVTLLRVKRLPNVTRESHIVKSENGDEGRMKLQALLKQ